MIDDILEQEALENLIDQGLHPDEAAMVLDMWRDEGVFDIK